MMPFRSSIKIQPDSPDSPNRPDRPNIPDGAKGFTYTVSRDQIDEYRRWPLDRRLQWLLFANKMRKFLPSKTIQFHEAFRQGKI